MRTLLTLFGRLIILAIALFWGWFIVLDGTGHLINDPDKITTAFMMVAFMIPLLGLVVASWRWPRLAGLFSLGLAVVVYWRFEHEAPRLMGALPMAAAGLMLLLGRGRRRPLLISAVPA